MLPSLLAVLLAQPTPLGFADHLLDTGDNYRAIGEYKRYLFEHTDGDRRDEAEFKIGLAYLRGERYAEAALFFDVLAQKAQLPAHRLRCLFEEADARYLEGDYAVAGGDFGLLAAEAQTPDPLRARAQYLAGWAALLAHRADLAREAFGRASADPIFGLKARGVIPQLSDEASLPHRSPALAGLLSAVVPGAGYIYLGQPSIAAAAFAWNGLFGAGVYDAASHHLWGVTAVLAVFEAMWYGGAIFGSVSGAQKFNRDAWLNYVDALKTSHDWKGDLPTNDDSDWASDAPATPAAPPVSPAAGP